MDKFLKRKDYVEIKDLIDKVNKSAETANKTWSQGEVLQYKDGVPKDIWPTKYRSVVFFTYLPEGATFAATKGHEKLDHRGVDDCVVLVKVYGGGIETRRTFSGHLELGLLEAEDSTIAASDTSIGGLEDLDMMNGDDGDSDDTDEDEED